MKKIYRHIYDNNVDANGNEKPNEFLGEFEVPEGAMDDYAFETIGMRDGKKYKITGVEISSLVDRYNSGTKCFVELIES